MTAVPVTSRRVRRSAWRPAQRVARRLAALEKLPVAEGIDWRGLPTLLLPMRCVPRLLAMLGIWCVVRHPVRSLRCRRIAEHWPGDVRRLAESAAKNDKNGDCAALMDAAVASAHPQPENAPEAPKTPRRAYGSITARVAEDMGERAALLRTLGMTWEAIGREIGCTKAMAWQLAHGTYRPAQGRRAA